MDHKFPEDETRPRSKRTAPWSAPSSSGGGFKPNPGGKLAVIVHQAGQAWRCRRDGVAGEMSSKFSKSSRQKQEGVGQAAQAEIMDHDEFQVENPCQDETDPQVV